MNDTVFDKFKSMSIDELTEWINHYHQGISPPWIEWLDKHYCANCDLIKTFVPDYGKEMSFSWCELHNTCKYFPEANGLLDDKQIIRMWLESQDYDNYNIVNSMKGGEIK